MRSIYIAETTGYKYIVVIGNEGGPKGESHLYHNKEELLTGVAELIQKEIGSEATIVESSTPETISSESITIPPAAQPVVMNTGEEPSPGQQPTPSIVDENPPMPFSMQPPSTFVQTEEMTPGGQPLPDKIK